MRNASSGTPDNSGEPETYKSPAETAHTNPPEEASVPPMVSPRGYNLPTSWVYLPHGIIPPAKPMLTSAMEKISHFQSVIK